MTGKSVLNDGERHYCPFMRTTRSAA
jgi:hypothetical protein